MSVGNLHQGLFGSQCLAIVEFGENLDRSLGIGRWTSLHGDVMVRPLFRTERIRVSRDADCEIVVPTHDPATRVTNSDPVSLRPTLLYYM